MMVSLHNQGLVEEIFIMLRMVSLHNQGLVEEVVLKLRVVVTKCCPNVGKDEKQIRVNVYPVRMNIFTLEKGCQRQVIVRSVLLRKVMDGNVKTKRIMRVLRMRNW